MSCWCQFRTRDGVALTDSRGSAHRLMGTFMRRYTPRGGLEAPAARQDVGLPAEDFIASWIGHCRQGLSGNAGHSRKPDAVKLP